MTLYPGWVCRFHYGPEVPVNVVQALRELPNVELVLMERKSDEPINATGMMWRFAPAFAGEDVDVVIVRDSDSRLSEREVKAVDEWLNSDKDVHIMRDCCFHKTKILAGMWGCRKGALHCLHQMYASYEHNGKYGDDEIFLALIYQFVKPKSWIHVDNGAAIYNGEDFHPFPCPLPNEKAFVGAISNDFTHWTKKNSNTA